MSQPPRKFLPLPPRASKPEQKVPPLEVPPLEELRSRPHPCEYTINLTLLQVAKDFGIDTARLKKSHDAVLRQLRDEENKLAQERRIELGRELISWFREQHSENPEETQDLFTMFGISNVSSPEVANDVEKRLSLLANRFKSLSSVEVDVGGDVYKTLTYELSGPQISLVQATLGHDQYGWSYQRVNYDGRTVYLLPLRKAEPHYTPPLNFDVLPAMFFIHGWEPTVNFE